MGGSHLIFLQRMKIATSKLAGWWDLPQPIIKSNPKEKRRGSKLGDLTKIWGFSLIFMQWLKVSTANLVDRVRGQLGSS